MPVTVLDLIVVVVILISAILAMVRGFIREVLSVASWVAAAAAAFFLYPSLEPLVAPYIGSDTVAKIVAAGIIFLITLIIASFITMKISDFVIDSRVGAIDRAFGFIFGAVRGVLILAVALLFFNWLAPNPPAWIADARTKPMLEGLGEQIVAAIPDDVEGSIFDRIKGGQPNDGAAETLPNDEAGTELPAYDNNQRGAIDQLIESTSPGTGN